MSTYETVIGVILIIILFVSIWTWLGMLNIRDDLKSAYIRDIRNHIEWLQNHLNAEMSFINMTIFNKVFSTEDDEDSENDEE